MQNVSNLLESHFADVSEEQDLIKISFEAEYDI